MPRVNRDLQRRMAARRERERRRPSGERRYQFGTPDPALEAEEALEQEEASGAVEAAAQRPRRDGNAIRAAATPARNVGRTHRPFSEYREEYAYVSGDLRRVGVVIGSLLAVLIVLYFVLPALVH